MNSSLSSSYPLVPCRNTIKISFKNQLPINDYETYQNNPNITAKSNDNNFNAAVDMLPNHPMIRNAILAGSSPLKVVSSHVFHDKNENVELKQCNINSAENSLENDHSREILYVSARPPVMKQLVDLHLLFDTRNRSHKRGLTELGLGWDDFAFIISSEWVERWLNFLKSDEILNDADWKHILNISNHTLVSDGHPLVDVSEMGDSTPFVLKNGLIKNIDYYLFPKAAWDALVSWYGGGPAIIRSLVNNSKLNDSNNVISEFEFGLKKSNTSLDSLESKDRDELNGIGPTDLLDLIKLFSNDFIVDLYPSNPPSLNEIVTKIHKSFHQLSTGKENNSNSLLAKSQPINDLQTTSLNVSSNRSHRHKCHVCHCISKTRCSKCTSIHYCGKDCQLIHWKYHKFTCKKLQDANSSGKLNIVDLRHSILNNSCLNGKVGLLNIGNSCYLNSSLQCLSHIAAMSIYFRSQKFEDHVNKQSKDGTGGILAQQYAKMLQDMWFDNKSFLSPYTIKGILGRINPEYAGLAQHDAHEVIELLLDKLHEDVNKVVSKPYTLKAEGNGNDDLEIAEETWKRHSLRDDSIIKDLVGSLTRSQLTCPDCGKLSVSFEYHNTHQIAIPRSNNRTFNVVFVPEIHPQDLSHTSPSQRILHDSQPICFEVTLDRLLTVKSLRLEIANKIPTLFLDRCSNILLLESSHDNYSVSRILKDIFQLSRINEKVIIFAYCPLMEMEEQMIVLQRIVKPNLEVANIKNSMQRSTLDSPMQLRLTGIPLVISFNRNWNCARVRHAIWQNIVKIFRVEDKVGLEIKDSLDKSSVVSQLLFASKLSLRVVDNQGLSKASLLSKTVSDEGVINEGNLQAIFEGSAVMSVDGIDNYAVWKNAVIERGGVNRLIGVEFPSGKEKSYEEFSMKYGEGNNLLFLALDLFGNHLKSADLAKMNKHLTRFANQHNESSRNLPSANNNNASQHITLDQCLREHTKSELLDAGNEWYCSNCKEHKAAKKIVKFWRPNLPEILILSLKRFEFRDLSSVLGGMKGVASHREKIDTYVDFPVNGLDLGPYCAQMNNNNDNNESVLYDLFAVCNHYGRMGFGHYTASARTYDNNNNNNNNDENNGDVNNGFGQWRCFDDKDVNDYTKEEDVKSSSAYILFYRKRATKLHNSTTNNNTQVVSEKR
eukprot:gene7584-10333_t